MCTKGELITLMGFLMGGSICSGAVITFDNSGLIPGAENFNISGYPASASTIPYSTTLSDNSVLTLTQSASTRFWSSDSGSTSWVSASVADSPLAQMNLVLGTNVQNFASCKYTYCGAQKVTNSVTLNLSSSTMVTPESSLTIFALVASNAGPLGGFSVTGLSSSIISYATATSTDFATYTSGNMTSAQGELALVKVTGVWNGTSNIVLKSTSAKNGWAMVAYTPEPGTAMLSMLALIGLVARRRRRMA